MSFQILGSLERIFLFFLLPDGKVQIMLKGTSDQVEQADRMIREQLEQLDAFERKARSSATESRSPRSKKRSSSNSSSNQTPPTLFLTSEENGSSSPPSSAKKDSVERLVQSTGEKSLGVFVSAISDPGKFFVQKARGRDISLDRGYDLQR